MPEWIKSFPNFDAYQDKVKSKTPPDFVPAHPETVMYDVEQMIIEVTVSLSIK